MNFYEACRVLQFTKLQLMELAYGRNFRGIDSAIPQGEFDRLHLSYGNSSDTLNAFYYVTDCRDSLYKLVFLPDHIEKHIQSAIILKAFYHSLYLSMLVKKTDENSLVDIRNRYSAIDDILESFKFDYKGGNND